MSTADAIRDMSETLRALLRARFPEVEVTIQSPQEDGSEPRLNLFLYQVSPDPQRRNLGPIYQQETAGGEYKLHPEPLVLNLRYLLTAFAEEATTEQRLLGGAIQAFHRYQILPPDMLRGGLRSGLTPPASTLVWLDMEPERLERIWGNESRHMRASVAYEVSCVFIDLDEPIVVPPAEHVLGDITLVPYLDYLEPDRAGPGDEVVIHGANLTRLYPTEGRAAPPDRDALEGWSPLDGLKVWFGDRSVVPLPGSPDAHILRVLVPARMPAGRTHVHLRFGTYESNARPFLVLLPEGTAPEEP